MNATCNLKAAVIPLHSASHGLRRTGGGIALYCLAGVVPVGRRMCWRGLLRRKNYVMLSLTAPLTVLYGRGAVGGRSGGTSDAITFESLGVVTCPLDMSQWHLSAAKGVKGSLISILEPT